MIFDCHDEAYYVWRDAGVRAATLVHVDAHGDVSPAPPGGLIHIANYVRAALRDGIVERVFWVIPDPLWRRPDDRRALLSHLDEEFPGHAIWTGTIGELCVLAEPVLLDVDLDYFITGRFSRDPAAAALDRPWASPASIARELRARCPDVSIATIATSITGGFTPVRWTPLALELRAALGGAPAPAPDAPDGRPHPFRTLGHVRLQEHRLRDAADAFRRALDTDPDDPWAALGLAMVEIEEGRLGDACARLISSTPIDSIDHWRARARILEARGDLPGAIAAYRRTMALAVAGAVPLSVWTSNRERRLVDPDHWRDHAALAALYDRTRDAAAAAAHRRIASAAGIAASAPAGERG